jgi:hypothetical protein
MAPLPYRAANRRKLIGLKNSSGGEEPDKSSPVVGDSRKRAKAGVSLSLFNIESFLSVFGQVCSAMIALSLHPSYRQGFSTHGAFEVLFALAQPFFSFAFSDSFKVCSYVFAIFQVAFCQVLILFASPVFVRAALVAEFQAFVSEALDDLAVVAPAFRRERHAAFASHLLGWTFEVFSERFQVFSVVPVSSVDRASSTVQSTSSNEVSVNQRLKLPTLRVSIVEKLFKKFGDRDFSLSLSSRSFWKRWKKMLDC